MLVTQLIGISLNSQHNLHMGKVNGMRNLNLNLNTFIPLKPSFYKSHLKFSLVFVSNLRCWSLNKYVAHIGMSLPDLHHLAILHTDILEYYLIDWIIQISRYCTLYSSSRQLPWEEICGTLSDLHQLTSCCSWKFFWAQISSHQLKCK